VMGRNLAAVDGTGARIMGVDPFKVKYLAKADGRIGPVESKHILQRGEDLATVRTDFQLLEKIPAQRGLKT